MSHISRAPSAFVRTANLDTSMMYMGSIMSFLVRGQETDGRFSMVKYRARPGNEPPPHVHCGNTRSSTCSKAEWSSTARIR